MRQVETQTLARRGVGEGMFRSCAPRAKKSERTNAKKLAAAKGPVSGEATVPHSAKTSNDMIECRCGFSCGTSAAWQRHVQRYEDQAESHVRVKGDLELDSAIRHQCGLVRGDLGQGAEGWDPKGREGKLQ